MKTLKVSLNILTVDLSDDDQIEMMEKVNRLITAIKSELEPEETMVQVFRGTSVDDDDDDDDDDSSYLSDDEFLLSVTGDTCNCPTCKARRAKNNQSRMN